MIDQILDVCVAREEPQELVDDRLGRHLLRREQRKTFGEVESHLVAENTERADTRPVLALFAMFEDMPQKIQVLMHTNKLPSQQNFSQFHIGTATLITTISRHVAWGGPQR